MPVTPSQPPFSARPAVSIPPKRGVSRGAKASLVVGAAVVMGLVTRFALLSEGDGVTASSVAVTAATSRPEVLSSSLAIQPAAPASIPAVSANQSPPAGTQTTAQPSGQGPTEPAKLPNPPATVAPRGPRTSPWSPHGRRLRSRARNLHSKRHARVRPNPHQSPRPAASARSPIWTTRISEARRIARFEGSRAYLSLYISH